MSASRTTCLLLTCFASATAMAGGDFNGDGFDDLAIAVIGEPVNGIHSGAVQVFPGSLSGPNSAASFLIDADTFGVLPADAALFGAACAWGDFDGDGFDDLAIGAPASTVANLTDAGRVFVLPGSASGFDLARKLAFDENTKGVKDKAEPEQKGATTSDDVFGSALAVGDFDADGFDDLAIGAPGERVGKKALAGAVHVLYGSATGLRVKRNQFWTKNSSGVKGKCGSFESFGQSLATGDLNGDGFDDLVIAIPGQSEAGVTGVGRVLALFGAKKGLRAKKNVLFRPSTNALPLTVDADDPGIALECADFDGDAFDDLAIGVFGEPAGGDKRGAVWVVPGSATGPAIAAMVGFAQGDGLVPGTSNDSDYFGYALCAADFNGDGKDDLAIGAPGETIAAEGCGRVTLLYGSANGIAAFGATTWDQDTVNVAGVAEMGDVFGAALGCQDFDGNGTPDLAIGAPGEAVGAASRAGAVNVLFAYSGFGVITAGNGILHQDQPSTVGVAEVNDLFGHAFGL